jgi:hypothetical protein
LKSNFSSDLFAATTSGVFKGHYGPQKTRIWKVLSNCSTQMLITSSGHSLRETSRWKAENPAATST